MLNSINSVRIRKKNLKKKLKFQTNNKTKDQKIK